MDARHCLFLSLLCLPTLAPAQEIVSGNQTATTSTAPDQVGAKPDEPLRVEKLDLKGANVQQLLRAAAARQATAPTTTQTPRQGGNDLAAIQQDLLHPVDRSARRQSDDPCAASDCGDDPLSRMQRNLTGLIFNNDRDFDHWLSCQQHDDMLSTFDRYEKCGQGYLPEREAVNVRPKLPKQGP
jgi:hypothetical protein